MAEITLRFANGTDLRVRAVARGDLAIHMEDCFAAETGGHTYAISHIPSGYRIDGHYLRAITLKSMLRNLSKLDWSGDAKTVMANLALKNAVIAEINRIELLKCDWPHRRNLKPVLSSEKQAVVDGALAKLDDEAALAAMEAGNSTA